MAQTKRQREDLKALQAQIAEHRRLHPHFFEIVEDTLIAAGYARMGTTRTVEKGQETWPTHMRHSIPDPGYWIATAGEGLTPTSRVAVFFSSGAEIEEQQGETVRDTMAHSALTMYAEALAPLGLILSIERDQKFNQWRLIVARPDGWAYTPPAKELPQ
jgi:hypothetical protein